MSNVTPAEVFPPGEFLKDELEERGWTQTEFAEIIRRPYRVVNEIILGKRAISPETAREISAALGTSAQFWMNLESIYQLSRVAPNVEPISREAALRERFPVREMIKRAWIPASRSIDELENSVRRYFNLSNLHDPIYFPHAAHRNHEERYSSFQLAWLFRVSQLAATLHVPRYSEIKLRASFDALERLMIEPEEIRHAPRLLAECGVRLVIVEPIPNSKIDGVCFWTDGKQSPVIGLTLKSDYIDKFWFNLWHELEHVVRGDGKDDPVLDDFDAPAPEEESERAANEAAENHCVPRAAMNNFIARHNPMFSEVSFIGFARLMKRHPGIVAGQLQKKTERWDLFKKKHQPRVREIVIQSVLTDGYGRKAPVSG